jgi:hypothetical protein
MRVTLILLGVLLSGCTERDELDRIADENSRVGTLADGLGSGMTGPGLAAGSAAAERLYYIQKYEATSEQVETVKRHGREYVKKNRASTRYVALRTPRDHRAKGKESVMIFDTQTAEIVGNSVYDLNTAPLPGAKFELNNHPMRYERN